jgi:hypothetical protein
MKITETIKSLEEKHLEFVKNLLPIAEQKFLVELCEEKF